VKYWLSVGVKPTDSVRILLVRRTCLVRRVICCASKKEVVKGIVTPWLKEDLKSKANALIKQTEIEMQTLERQLRQLSVMVPGQNGTER